MIDFSKELEINAKKDKNIDFNAIIGIISDNNLNKKTQIVDKFMQKIQFIAKCKYLFIFRQCLNIMSVLNYSGK